MQIMRIFLIGWVMAVFTLCGICPQAGASDSSPPEILYLSSASGDISLDLESEDTEGFWGTACENAIRVEVDGKAVPHDLSLNNDNTAVVKASFSGLEDGRHKAGAEVSESNGLDASRKEALFIVDTSPPVLDLLQPETPRIEPTQATFLVRCRDDGAGVSPDAEESGLRITINERRAEWRLTEEDGYAVFLVYCNTPICDADQDVRLHVSIMDRAGNTAALDRSFRIDTPEQEWDVETIECVDEEGNMFEESWYFTRRSSFPLTTSIHWIHFDEAVRAITVSLELNVTYERSGKLLDRGLFYALEDSLEIVSNHPCIRVERLPGSMDRPGPGVNFRVSQVSLPDGPETLGSIKIQYPESYVSEWDMSCPEAGYENVIKELTPDGPAKSFNIPVMLYSEGCRYSDEVQVLDDRLIYQFTMTGPGCLDTSSSWFEMEGTRQWLTEVEQGVYEASVPLTEEGLHVYTTRLALSGMWGWGDEHTGEVSDGGRSLLKTGDIFVKLDPPRIEHFHYDRESECFRAVVSDRGTPLEDLVLELIVSGAGTLDPGFDPFPGTVEAPFPMPTGVQAGRLKVTDLAGQTSTSACQVFGAAPPSLPVEGPHKEYPATVKEASRSGSVRPSGVSSGSGGLISRQYLGKYKDGKEAVTECITTKVVESHPFATCLQSAYARFGKASVSGTTQIMKPEPSPALIKAEKECRDKYPEGITWSSRRFTKKECRNIWIDTLAPRIQGVAFLPTGRRITALIDDHGMPLSELTINYYITPDCRFNSRGERPPFSFDTKTGLFLGDTSVQNEVEIFAVGLHAKDAAGNWSNKWLDVTAPISPPDVSLEILKNGPVAYPWGSCYDRSGIDHRKTRAWVDGRPVTLVGVRYGQGASPDRVEFGPVTEEGAHMARLEVTDFAGLSSEASVAFDVSFPPKIDNFRRLPESLQNAGGPAFSAFIHDSGKDLYLEGIELSVDGAAVDRARLYYEPRTGYFAADGPLELSPDTHLARLTATDANGNRDEAFLRFVPGERIEVREKGLGELSVEEVTLWELLDHNGDGKANPGETIRLFVGLANHGSAGLEGVRGRLESGEPGIVAERDEIAFGDLEQDGTLTPRHGFDIRIDDDFPGNTFSDPYEAGFTLEAQDKTGKTWLLDFHVPVYRPTLPFDVPPTSSGQADPANPDSGNILLSEVVVTLNNLPPNTEEAEIEVAGTVVSTASIVDEVMVRVNGALHAADWNPMDGSFSVTVGLDLGDNLIEVEAVDRTGAIGMDTGFVHRSEPYVAPEIEITEPPQGAAFFCGSIHLRGNFSAGSSEINGFQAFMTAAGETVSFPIGYSSGEGTFWSGTNSVEEPLNTYFPFEDNGSADETITVTVVLTTEGGDVVQDSVAFTYTCFY